jgi:hypothetical protein
MHLPLVRLDEHLRLVLAHLPDLVDRIGLGFGLPRDPEFDQELIELCFLERIELSQRVLDTPAIHDAAVDIVKDAADQGERAGHLLRGRARSKRWTLSGWGLVGTSSVW